MPGQTHNVPPAAREPIALVKANDYAVTRAWLVTVDGSPVGSVEPCWPGLYSARPHWRGHVGGIPVGTPCKSRRDAAVHVLAAHERRTARAGGGQVSEHSASEPRGIAPVAPLRPRSVPDMTASTFGPVAAGLVPDHERELSELTTAELDELYESAVEDYRAALTFAGRVRREMRQRREVSS